jgi:uncharacterized protein
VLIDEYTDEELAFCVQVISQIAAHPACDGNVGMMGKSWSAINSLMVAARKDRPAALKAITSATAATTATKMTSTTWAAR